MAKKKSIISNQSKHPIIVKGKTVPPFGTANDVSISMIQQLRIVYGENVIEVIDGPDVKVKRGPVSLNILPPPVTNEYTIPQEEAAVSNMRKFYVTGRFKGMTQVDVAAIVMGGGDRVVKDVESCTHILAGENPAKSVVEYAAVNELDILKLEDLS